MKKLLFVFAVAVFATACNNDAKTEETKTDTTVVTPAPDTTVKMAPDTTVVVTDTTKKM